MRLLLDTNAWLFMINAPDRLGERLAATLRDPANELFLSVASVWEMVIQYSLGKLPLPVPPNEFVPPRLRRDRVRLLPVTAEQLFAVSALPYHHRDPFDRLLIGAAVTESLTLVTTDAALRAYGVPLITNR
ncbi:MAG: type II toxin-antitoxin system VapC family toxin [Dehalococcoidia bacterium]